MWLLHLLLLLLVLMTSYVECGCYWTGWKRSPSWPELRCENGYWKANQDSHIGRHGKKTYKVECCKN
ncbi:hypothetical protein L596_025367 [Steinernema carpocapsae]|uniref:Secreted protein n=1 Tax=Steinernema carpocapsae TaxID=34508 RepID=A0A4U5M7K2_STECR|nr:hypothetical protein L596_025367 [Steinernema carpocapsae]